MTKAKETTKPAAKKDETKEVAAPKLQTITNHAVQHRTVCVGVDAIPLPPGATAPLSEKAAEWCKNSAVVQAWLKKREMSIQDVESEVESEEE